MPCSHTIHVEQRLVRIRMWGAITREEIAATRANLATDPQFSPGFSELIDLSAVTSAQAITSHDIQAIAANVNPVSRRAFLAPNPEAYGLVRMFQTLRTLNDAVEQIALFKTLAEAEAWLDVNASA